MAQATASGLDDTADDELMARMLQLEYDKQYDQEVLAKEKQYNKDTKGTCILGVDFVQVAHLVTNGYLHF